MDGPTTTATTISINAIITHINISFGVNTHATAASK